MFQKELGFMECVIIKEGLQKDSVKIGSSKDQPTANSCERHSGIKVLFLILQ